MKNTCQSITSKEFVAFFSNFNNYPQLFTQLTESDKKVPSSFLKLGQLDEDKEKQFIRENKFSLKFLINSSDNKFLFNELIEDDFHVSSGKTISFNINVLQSFKVYNFSSALLCEKENPEFPGLIISYFNDQEYWFVIQ